MRHAAKFRVFDDSLRMEAKGRPQSPRAGRNAAAAAAANKNARVADREALTAG